MSVNAGITNNLLWPNYSKENLDKIEPTGAEKTLGQEDFLTILITQLSNQDPTQPMKDTEFIAQMAQFSSVQQLSEISQQITSLQQSLGMSSTMIGKEVTWTQIATGTDDASGVMSGIVDSIIIRSGVQYAVVGEYEIKLDDITKISQPGSSDASAEQAGEES